MPRIYPTRIFGVLLFVLTAMWYAGASQNNAANYLLFFCTLAVVLISIPHTLLNLSGLTTRTESVKPTFAGQEVAVSVEVLNNSRRSRRACVLDLAAHNGPAETIDQIGGGRAARVTLRFPAERRGEHLLGNVDLRSIYPLGFLCARRRVPTAQRYLVYPKPEGSPQLPQALRGAAGARPESTFGEGDDYAGVRAYVAGESQRQVDWKAVARGQPMMTKQFTAESDDVVQLLFAATTSIDLERRLSQLALWVVEAERSHRRYSLQLPGTELRAGSGDAHYHRCLRALALYQ